MHLNKIKITFLAGLILWGTACGSGNRSIFDKIDDKTPEQEAAYHLEHNAPDEAIEVLEKALRRRPHNYVWVSMLSAAYAQKFEVDLITIALKLAGGENSDGPGGGDQDILIMLWPYLPRAIPAILTGIEYANYLLTSIPMSQRTEADYLKLALLGLINASMRLKSLDTNENGILEPFELFLLDEESALVLLNMISAAASASNDLFDSGDQSTSDIARRIDGLNQNIQNNEGASATERIAGYFNVQVPAPGIP